MAVQNPIEAERKAGREAAQALRSFLKDKHKSLFEKRTGNLQKVATRIRMRDFHLVAVSLQTVNYAFIQHHGVTKTRKSHEVKSSGGKLFTRKEHPFALQAKNHLELPSAVLDKLATNISEIRAETVLTEISKRWPQGV